jgi:hypothetical protein
MPRRTLAKIVESIILVQELPMKWKNMAKYCQKYYDNDEFDDFDNEDEHHGKKTKKKSKKIDFDIVRKVYCENCFNEGHFRKRMQIVDGIFVGFARQVTITQINVLVICEWKLSLKRYYTRRSSTNRSARGTRTKKITNL